MRTGVTRAACVLALALGSLGAGLGLTSQGVARDRPLPPGASETPGALPTQLVASAVPVQPGAATPHALRGLDQLGSVTTHSGAATGEVDPASLAARDIARRVRSFHSFRSEIPLARWRTEDAARWRVRRSARCLSAADKLRLPAQPLERALLTPVPTPILLTGPVGGVSYRPVQSDRQIELSCELATRLPALSALLRAHGVRVAHVNSSYRDQPRVSFHTFGLALDIASFETKSGPLVVATDFELAPDVATCDAKPTSERGRALLALACALADSGLFSSVLTPNYNAGHRDHFHLDIRPDDSRLFLR